MRFSILTMPVFGLALLVSASPASADDLEGLERKALSLQKEAAELFQKGHEDEAHSLERESDGLILKVRQLQQAKQKKSGKPEGIREKKSEAGDPESQQDTWQLKPDLKRLLHERLQDLHAARKQAEVRKAPERELDEIREQISQTERKLAHLSEPSHPRKEIPPQFRAQAEKLENATRRLQHIRVAAENLKAAELHDIAHELMKKAEAMEREVHAARSELAKAMQNSEAKDQEPGDELKQLRSENEKLRREMKELREVIEQLRKDSEK